jgi:hypothetical protein
VMSPASHFAIRDTCLSEKSKEETISSVAKKLEKPSGISNHIRDLQQSLKGWETKISGYKKPQKACKNYNDASELED